MSGGAHSEAERSSNSVSTDHNSIDKLNADLPGRLQINDGNRMESANDSVPIGDGFCFVQDEDEDDDEEEEDEDDLSEEDLLAQMGYAKSKPKTNIAEPQRQHCWKEEEEQDVIDHSKNEPPKHETITTTPAADLKLVSAVKGSREKEGKPAKECRVSWAPDVYDPPPSAEYFAKGGTEMCDTDQNVKGAAAKTRQKGHGKGAGTSEGRGKGSRGRKKDKKQGKKHGGRGGKGRDYGDD